jgi:hypothetical protein
VTSPKTETTCNGWAYRRRDRSGFHGLGDDAAVFYIIPPQKLLDAARDPLWFAAGQRKTSWSAQLERS